MFKSSNTTRTDGDSTSLPADVSVSSSEPTNSQECGRKRSRPLEVEETANGKNALRVVTNQNLPLLRPQPITKRQKNELKPSPPSCPLDTNPEVYVKQLFESSLGFTVAERPTLELSLSNSDKYFFPALTEDNLNGYEMDIITAIRDEDLVTLRALHSAGRSMSCSNRFGESLIHMACRRGFTSIVKFLVEEAGVPIRITDDGGRTPLHDTLWNRDCQYEIFNMLVERDPALLLVSDKRGHTPFAYARKEHWNNWLVHLSARKDGLKESLDTDVMELFCKESSIL